jgi:DNA-binding NarL/FixJ family response regulator
MSSVGVCASACQAANEMPVRLTTREREVVSLVADGKTYKEIAQILGLSSKTVDCHSQKIKRKTQCHSVALLVRLAIRNGWVEL